MPPAEATSSEHRGRASRGSDFAVFLEGRGERERERKRERESGWQISSDPFTSFDSDASWSRRSSCAVTRLRPPPPRVPSRDARAALKRGRARLLVSISSRNERAGRRSASPRDKVQRMRVSIKSRASSERVKSETKVSPRVPKARRALTRAARRLGCFPIKSQGQGLPLRSVR